MNGNPSRTNTLLAAAAGLGAVGVGAAFFAAPPERFWSNWVVWLLALFTLALGALFMVALEHLVAARWSVPLRRVPERIATLLIPAIPVVLLGLFALPVLYPGTRPEALQNPLLAGKAAFLSIPWFSLRVVLGLALSLLGLWILVKGSLDQDRTLDPAQNLRARKFAPAFMFIFGLVITFAGWDWVKGLTPEWFSDIFGVYIFAGSFLAALAATVLVGFHLIRSGRLEGIRHDHLYNLGGFLFAFTVFWSYIGFAQYMLIWYANLPEEIFWYKDRLAGGWHTVTLLLAIVHFLIPFFALVTRHAKGDPRRLQAVAVLMLGAHLLDLYWLVFPTLRQGVLFSWPELSFLLCFLAGSALWIRRSLAWGKDMPVGDPFLQKGLEFHL